MGLCVSIPFCLTRAACAVACVCLLGGSVCGAWADKTIKLKKEHRRAESHQIEFMEQQWLHALVNKDTASLEKMMADDFLAISANGTLADKQQYLHHVLSGYNRFTNIDVMDIKVRMQPSSAVVVSQVRVLGSLEGHPVSGVFRYTKVYGRAPGGQWRVLNLEATRVSGVLPDDTGMHRGIPLNMRHMADH